MSGESSSRAHLLKNLSEEEIAQDYALNFYEFLASAKSNTDFAQCFGLFDLLYRLIVQPVEKKLFGVSLLVDEMTGQLEMKKSGVGFCFLVFFMFFLCIFVFFFVYICLSCFCISFCILVCFPFSLSFSLPLLLSPSSFLSHHTKND